MPTLPRLLDLRRPHSQSLAVLALLFTLLNAIKPLQVDDAAYYYYARQAAREPSQPYGFIVFWYQWPYPANEVLAPPLLPYWWSLAIRLFGENVFLWKLWLLPFSLLFVWSLDALFRRFARGLETPLTWLTVLSPTFFPSLNLMLDIPALALGLAGLTVFTRATARSSLTLAVLSGVLAALAMQTKYTGLLFPVVIVFYGLLFRPGSLNQDRRRGRSPVRLLAGWSRGSELKGALVRLFLCAITVIYRLRVVAVSVLVAALLFLCWEMFVIRQHGQSHFLYHLDEAERLVFPQGRRVSWWQGFWMRIDRKLPLAWPFLPILGGVGPALILLGLAALRVRAWVVGLMGALLVLGYLLVAACQPTFYRVETRTLGDPDQVTVWGPLALEYVLFGVYGLLLIGTTLGVLWMLHVGGRKDRRTGDAVVDAGWRLVPLEVEPVLCEVAGEEPAPSLLCQYVCSAQRRLDWFLLLWLGLEVAGYFALTPFPAVRRVMGLIVVVTLLAGRRAAQTCRVPGRETLVWAITGGGIALGAMFYTIDLRDAFAEKGAAEDAAAFIRARDRDARIWFVGHWGFQHYAERAGMQPVKPNGYWRVEPSLLKPGDWLVVPERITQQDIVIDGERVEHVVEIHNTDPVPMPLRMVQNYYGGYSPVEHQEAPRIIVHIYKVTSDWVPQSAW